MFEAGLKYVSLFGCHFGVPSAHFSRFTGLGRLPLGFPRTPLSSRPPPPASSTTTATLRRALKPGLEQQLVVVEGLSRFRFLLVNSLIRLG